MEAATPGEWEWRESYGITTFGPIAGNYSGVIMGESDAAFIATMRSLAPLMLRVCEAAKEMRDCTNGNVIQSKLDAFDAALADLDATT